MFKCFDYLLAQGVKILKDNYIMVSLVVVLVVLNRLSNLNPRGGLNRLPALHGGAIIGPFSYMDEDIGQGVPGSMSGVHNKAAAPVAEPVCNKNQPERVYYGHGVPLRYEDRAPGPLVDNNGTLHMHHLCVDCKPECCPSPYSCDHGCLCAALDQKR